MAVARGKKATLASVAAQANVSKITASRAFSQPDKVHPETLQRILATAEQLGYVVNTAARSLRAKSSKTIGIVNPDMANPFFGGLTRLMTLEAQKLGYDTLVFDSYESQETENSIIDRLMGYNVDAIILSVISNDLHYRPAYLQRLETLNIPVVLVDRELDAGWCSGVYIDNLDCGLQAGRWLLEQQVQRVVVVSGPENSNVARERVIGLQAALQGRIASFEVLHADFFMDAAWQETRRWLTDNPAPDYFVGCNNQISLGIIKACIEHKLALTQQVSLFSIDEVANAGIYGFHFPCITHDLQEIAWQALNLAIRRVGEQESKAGKVVVRGRVVP
ncbi:substrate-binding domain-containing protein [Erwinia sp. E602]|uniref:LacI family DNA-binding transcriptional regulator n=1 Tax=unclassified Erwinia TaxID=2622719 RepID=UPI0006FC1E95|nr:MULTISPECIES: LacI family DNA-binding transcriptional regulator [unclassified Erwinia]KQN54816.1 LacI family transcriptional regulator [Erwinia sp. Leaf53]PLV57750.1 LacI family transcriptional regulator [Erwinia sp. B116]QUG74679.1 substrate-binding domain-containing protein [Erwinia sp. E602]